jgi:hypothetical protein
MLSSEKIPDSMFRMYDSSLFFGRNFVERNFLFGLFMLSFFVYCI